MFEFDGINKFVSFLEISSAFSSVRIDLNFTHFSIFETISSNEKNISLGGRMHISFLNFE